ncbi:SidA/IucD/PvdA family monooxygenase [Microcoleus sp. FACHB-1515]|uniref:FAD/NAD(P)-binding protein n=1 Tax=Cyanophyceae TaxID=3028117 RepID=UPI00168653EA|nr:FAD/NAD(P)-binding protein [Microcoleus sp. FACHB-1515]MBD2090187.1 SidA/IucD/PvdA family monooxygenase [Microcoleus sp. FACHB-1515]
MTNVLPVPASIDLAVIGAGPQALTLVTHILQKRRSMRQRLLVFDQSGRWMQQWNRQFAQLEIPHLRSPAVHHPDPDPFALRRFAESRPAELFAPYDLPGTRLFQEFCQQVIDRWQLRDTVPSALRDTVPGALRDRVYPAHVTRIEPIANRRSRFRLWLDDGHSIIARRVVFANGGSKPQLPNWVSQISNHPINRLVHSGQIDLRSLRLAGKQVLIVGGGLTSGHLAVGAIDRGARVILMSRRCLYEKQFDADPGWLGPKYLKGFQAESCWQTRYAMIQQARNGGSMTPAMMTRLRRAQHDGRLVFYEQCQIAKAQWIGQSWRVCCDNHAVHECIHAEAIDRIWLATGSTLDISQHSMLSEVQARYPIEVINGLPVLDKHLRWPGCELFVMGGFAALQVGPTARNLYGARLASDRITPAIVKSSLAIN